MEVGLDVIVGLAMLAGVGFGIILCKFGEYYAKNC